MESDCNAFESIIINDNKINRIPPIHHKLLFNFPVNTRRSYLKDTIYSNREKELRVLYHQIHTQKLIPKDLMNRIEVINFMRIILLKKS